MIYLAIKSTSCEVWQKQNIEFANKQMKEFHYDSD